ncbi:MAG: hypothetical protein C4K58_02630 [Flavobacteriaceae bacterium]|nr:MAG: hypothetical protein C4K58_02630 [Flavobacteriaceae bacterium]
MFVDFFYFLRSQKVTITLIEFLDLLKALEKNLSNCSVDEFYYLSKTILIKNEKDLDRFDQVFGEFFKGLAPLDEVPLNIEESWINKLKNRTFTPEEKAMIEANKIIFVGDASMSSYEILSPGGSVEHANETPGIVWLGKIKKKYKNIVWLNPVQEDQWKYTQSIGIISEIFEHKMFPLTLTGISKAMKELQKKH